MRGNCRVKVVKVLGLDLLFQFSPNLTLTRVALVSQKIIIVAA